MVATISSQKPEVIQDHFGIGVKTWVKIREGEAIRRSVAARLIERLTREALI
jgi:microcompartment protein CcmK/EutM